MSAQHIYDTALLGVLIRFSNGEPRPPARFKRKLGQWENRNAVGRLTKKQPGWVRPSGAHPASLTLDLGDDGMAGVVTLVLSNSFFVTSALDFSVVELPRAGMARVVTSWEGVDELRHLASDLAAAETWLTSHHWSNVRIEIVPEAEAPLAAPAVGRAA